jgi:uncharacterized protein YuzE
MNRPVTGIEVSVSARDDGTLEAVYVTFRTGEVAETREIDGDVLLADYDAQGRLLGVELLAPVRLSDIVTLLPTTRQTRVHNFLRQRAPREFLATA